MFQDIRLSEAETVIRIAYRKPFLLPTNARSNQTSFWPKKQAPAPPNAREYPTEPPGPADIRGPRKRPEACRARRGPAENAPQSARLQSLCCLVPGVVAGTLRQGWGFCTER